MSDTRTCEVREVLEEVLEIFPGSSDPEPTHATHEGWRVVVTNRVGQVISACREEGIFVIHLSPNGDITFSSSRLLGGAEGVARRNGHLQGVEELPREFREALQSLIAARKRALGN